MPTPLKIALVGPESSGKTTLAAQLAGHYGTVWVPEYARTYLTSLDRAYTQDDLTKIAKGQLELEASLASQATRLLICDTNLLVMEIWSQVAYGYVAPDLAALLNLSTYHLYLLLSPDLPWQPDPLREHPDPADRTELFKRYESSLIHHALPYATIAGIGDQRLHQAIHAIDAHHVSLPR